MVLKYIDLKCFLWGLTITSVALGFPLQVYTGSAMAAIVPYILILFIFLLTSLGFKNNVIRVGVMLPSSPIGLMVQVYMFLVVVHTIIQVSITVISISESISVFIIYILPLLFYFYFRFLGTEKEIKVVLLSIFISSLIIGLYFAYDSYIKLTPPYQITEYAVKAHEYSQSRSPDREISQHRLMYGRSQGLLESHVVSGMWVVIGMISLLSLLEVRKKITRLVAIIIYSILLVLGLNFTSIIAFCCIIFLFEIGAISFFQLKLPIKVLINTMGALIFLYSLNNVLEFLLGEKMFETVANSLSGQKDLALGVRGGAREISYLDITLNNIEIYFSYILEVPYSILVGDGYSRFGLKKGGDTGFVESVTKLGIPYSLALFFGIYILLKKSIHKIRLLKIGVIIDKGINLIILQFSVSFMVLIFISEIHYSIWHAKSILPIFFFSIAMFDRVFGESNDLEFNK